MKKKLKKIKLIVNHPKTKSLLGMDKKNFNSQTFFKNIEKPA